jgi:hypothetical protein
MFPYCGPARSKISVGDKNCLGDFFLPSSPLEDYMPIWKRASELIVESLRMQVIDVF